MKFSYVLAHSAECRIGRVSQFVGPREEFQVLVVLGQFPGGFHPLEDVQLGCHTKYSSTTCRYVRRKNTCSIFA